MSPARFETAAPARPSRTDGAGGFILLESLIALTIAGLLLVTLSRSFLSIWQGTAHAREDLQAIMIARSVLEGALPRSGLAPNACASPIRWAMPPPTARVRS